jgi:hypothetical protein
MSHRFAEILRGGVEGFRRNELYSAKESNVAGGTYPRFQLRRASFEPKARAKRLLSRCG